jgi:hypothetical protein
MGVPAWRHIDLLPVMARDLDEDDEDEDEDDDRPDDNDLDGMFDRTQRKPLAGNKP